jgi:hypothetical protein
MQISRYIYIQLKRIAIISQSFRIVFPYYANVCPTSGSAKKSVDWDDSSKHWDNAEYTLVENYITQMTFYSDLQYDSCLFYGNIP